MMGMSDDKNVGTLLLAIGGGIKPKESEKEDASESVLSICAERVMECIKAGDTEGFIKELPKLLALLPSPDFSNSEYDED